MRLRLDGEGVPEGPRGRGAPPDVRRGRGGGAGQQCGGASAAARGDLEEAESGHGERGGQPIRGAAAVGGGDVPAGRAERGGLPHRVLPSTTVVTNQSRAVIWSWNHPRRDRHGQHRLRSPAPKMSASGDDNSMSVRPSHRGEIRPQRDP